MALKREWEGGRAETEQVHPRRVWDFLVRAQKENVTRNAGKPHVRLFRARANTSARTLQHTERGCIPHQESGSLLPLSAVLAHVTLHSLHSSVLQKLTDRTAGQRRDDKGFSK